MKKQKIRIANGKYIDTLKVDPLKTVINGISRKVNRSEKVSAINKNEHLNNQLQINGSSPSEGLIDTEKMRNETITIVGAGAMGSRDILLLAPIIFRLITIDFDVVEFRNLINERTVLYSEKDIGKKKVYAAQERIAVLYPKTKVIAYAKNVNEMSESEILYIGKRSSIVICAIDNGPGIVYLNKILYNHVPVFYQGVHAQGRSGQIIRTYPGSPCLKCCMDINTGSEIRTLHREPGLGIHFASIAQLTVQLVIQELAVKHGSTLGNPLSPEVNMLYMTNMATDLTPMGPGIVPFKINRKPSCDICGRR